MPPRKRAVTPAVLNYSQAAIYLGLSRTTIWRMVAAGTFPVVHLSPKRRGIAVDELDAYIEARTEKSA